MILLPLRTPLLKNGDNLAAILMKANEIRPNDIIAISSKAVATVEGAAIDMQTLTVSDDARTWSTKTNLPPEFCQAVVEECARLNGKIIRAVPHALMTRLRPEGLRRGKAKLYPEGMEGSLLVPNAGLDRSNIGDGFCIGWPRNPVASATVLCENILGLLVNWNTQEKQDSNKPINQLTNKRVAVIITDSCLRPGRRGVTALALVTSGIAPVRDERGTQDLFNKPLQITEEATADQLATAANILMGNAAQSTPAVIIRNHGIPLEDWSGWVPGIRAEEDIFPS